MSITVFEIERIPLAIAAIMLSCITGLLTSNLISNVTPIWWQVISALFGKAGDKLDRKSRKRPDLIFRGLIIFIMATAFGLIAIKGIYALIGRIPFYGITEIIILSLALSSGGVWAAMINLHKTIESKTAGQGAYLTLATSARLNLSNADTHTIGRAALGFNSFTFDRALIAPIFFYLMLGIEGTILFTVFAALSWRFGKSGFTKGFGSVSLLAQAVTGFVPSLMTAIFLRFSSFFTPKSRKFYKVGWHNYTQGGLPLSVSASALNISLGGTFQDITGSSIKGSWIGPEGASARNDHHHIKRAVYMTILAHILLILTLLVIYLAGKGIYPSFILDLLS